MHPKSAREFARNVAIGAVGLVAGTWFIAWLTQLKVFENPQGQVNAVTAFFAWLIAQSWFVWLSGIVIGFGIGVWIDAALARRAAKRWWLNVQAFSIRDAACLLANVKRSEFEKSDRAAAMANELRGYVNSGHVPLFMEFEFEKDLDLDNLKYEPPYDKKSVGFDAVIAKATVELMARGRKLSLPWPIPPKVEKDAHRPFPRPKPRRTETVWCAPSNHLGRLAGERKAIAASPPAIVTSHPRVLAEAKAILRQLDGRLGYVSRVLETDDPAELGKWCSKIERERVDFDDLDKSPMDALTDKEREQVRVAVRMLAELDRHISLTVAEPEKFPAGHIAGSYKHRAENARTVLQELIENMEAAE